MIGFPFAELVSYLWRGRTSASDVRKIPDRAKDWPMWEKCVGCGEGLFAGDAFCGNCGRAVAPAVPAAREPDGLESAPLAVPTTAPAADLVQVRIIPAGHDLASSAQADPAQAGPAQADSGQAQPPEQALAAIDPTSPQNAAAPENAVAADSPAQPHDSQRQPQILAAGKSGPVIAAPVRPVATRLSGSANLDPVRNARYLAYVLRQAGLFTGSTCSSRRSCGWACCSAGRPGRPSGPPSGWR